MSRFVLVHGAWHGAWCWARVVPLLAARGHDARALDLPGHGDDPTPPGEVGWDDYMARMGEVIAEADEPPILVGHSLGGAVITGAADRWPERIRALVYHDCSDADAARAAARLRPQPARALAMGFELAPERFGRIPRHYVECRQDRAIDLASQRAMHAKLPCTVHTLDASHSPFYSMPERLADVLDRAAREGS